MTRGWSVGFALLAVTACAPPPSPPALPPVDTPPTPQEAPERVTQHVVLGGCVVQGSDPNTFLLAHAIDPLHPPSGGGAGATGTTYRLASASHLDFTLYVGNRIEAVGTAEFRTVAPRPSGTGPADALLPQFTVTSLEATGERCAGQFSTRSATIGSSAAARLAGR